MLGEGSQGSGEADVLDKWSEAGQERLSDPYSYRRMPCLSSGWDGGEIVGRV